LEHKNENFFKELGYDVWNAIENGYTAPVTPHVDSVEKNISYYVSKSMSTIQCDLAES